MSKCEVKNIQSGEKFQIPPDGMTFGRTGGPANITVSDQSVSKRHARIFCDNGQWVLEDLKSVNGTVVNNRRITEPVPITPGFVFALSKHQFEVVSVDGPSSSKQKQNAGANGNGESDPSARPSPKSKVAPAMAAKQGRASGGPSGQPVPVPDAEPLLPPEPPSNRSRSSMQQPPPQNGGYEDSGMGANQSGLANDPYLDELQGGGDASGGAAAVVAALPKAIAYYLANVPLMALNPIGTIRKGVENPKLKAMGAIELIAFFLPVGLASQVLASWAAAIASLIIGTGFQVMLFFPIVGLIIGVISAVISGLITHPVLKFIIERIFKGETDEKTRTNFVVMMQTSTVIVAIPGALAVLLTAVIAKLAASFSAASLLQILPALLMAVVTWIPSFIVWKWIQAWRCVKWAQTVFMVLFILSVLAGVGRAVTGVLAAINGMHSTPSAVVIDDSAVKKAKEDAEKALDDAKKNTDEAKKAGDDAAKATKAAGDDAKATKASSDDTKATKSSGDDAKATKASSDDAKATKASSDDAKASKASDDSASSDNANAAKGSYGDYKHKRDTIEKLIKNDPTLLDRKGMYGAYSDLSSCTYKGISDAETQVLGPRKRYDGEKKLLLDAVTERKVYERCRGTVDQLWRGLPHD